MGRNVGRLTARTVSAISGRGYYADGDGLYLQVSAFDTKSWVLRWYFTDPATQKRRSREMGLGPINTVSLAEAREEARKCRQMLRDGVDPIEARKSVKLAAKAATATVVTFKECAEAYIKAHSPGWKNLKHAGQWTATLETYVFPIMGGLSVEAIDTGLVLKAIEPIWNEKTETASRVRGRIEAILDWAAARKYRSGENPARWRGHLDKLLPAKTKVQRVEHHAALPYDQIGAFMASLRTQDGCAARALEFAILTASRTGEAIGATWDEIDLEKRLWTIPGERMKAGREHQIPLSDGAIAVLNAMAEMRQGDYVFAGDKSSNSLSSMALLMTLRRMGRADITAHGFRSTFRDWAGETTAYPREVIEHALAHQLKDKAEAAYQRGSLLEKRRRLMADWSSFCDAIQGRGDNVTAIRG